MNDEWRMNQEPCGCGDCDQCRQLKFDIEDKLMQTPWYVPSLIDECDDEDDFDFFDDEDDYE